MVPLTGASVAYWSLLVVAGVVNFCSDKYWSFSPDSSRRPGHVTRPLQVRRLLALTVAMLLSGVLVVAVTDAFILVVSLFMLVVAATTLTFQLY